MGSFFISFFGIMILLFILTGNHIDTKKQEQVSERIKTRCDSWFERTKRGDEMARELREGFKTDPNFREKKYAEFNKILEGIPAFDGIRMNPRSYGNGDQEWALIEMAHAAKAGAI